MTPFGQKLVWLATDKSMTGWPQDTTNADRHLESSEATGQQHHSQFLLRDNSNIQNCLLSKFFETAFQKYIN